MSSSAQIVLATKYVAALVVFIIIVLILFGPQTGLSATTITSVLWWSALVLIASGIGSKIAGGPINPLKDITLFS